METGDKEKYFRDAAKIKQRDRVIPTHPGCLPRRYTIPSRVYTTRVYRRGHLVGGNLLVAGQHDSVP